MNEMKFLLRSSLYQLERSSPAVRWMEDADREEILHETLENEYKIVKSETNT